MATLNPQSLVTLWQIEQYGSFSATAKATGWSQPAISQQIKKLEAQCGSTLVQRTSHGVELTATGSMLARHGEAIADRLERAAREVEDYRHHRFAHLHLVAPPSICSTIAARTVVKLSMFTDIELSLIQMEPPEAISAPRTMLVGSLMLDVSESVHWEASRAPATRVVVPVLAVAAMLAFVLV